MKLPFLPEYRNGRLTSLGLADAGPPIRSDHEPVQRGALVATSSRPAKAVNQDACAVFDGKAFKAVLCFDGVGSSLDSAIASNLACRTYIEGLRRDDEQSAAISQAFLEDLAADAHRALTDCLRSNPDRYENAPTPLETTALCVVETHRQVWVSAIGNGSIYRVRGDFRDFLPHWPWCNVELVIGHSLLGAQGREVLYSTLNPAVPPQVEILSFAKDRERGEIIVATTDGVSSPDQHRSGEDRASRLWREVNPHIRALFAERLPKLLGSGRQPAAEEVKVELESFLSERSFQDDATIGLLITEAALKYEANKAKGAHI